MNVSPIGKLRKLRHGRSMMGVRRIEPQFWGSIGMLFKFHLSTEIWISFSRELVGSKETFVCRE